MPSKLVLHGLTATSTSNALSFHKNSITVYSEQLFVQSCSVCVRMACGCSSFKECSVCRCIQAPVAVFVSVSSVLLLAE